MGTQEVVDAYRCLAPLAREFNIHRIKEQGRIAAVELRGEQQQPIGKPIPAQTKAQIAAPRCVALYTSNPECGHKDGRRDAPRLSAASRPTIDNLQPIPKAATNAKAPAQPRAPQASPTLRRPPARLRQGPKATAPAEAPAQVATGTLCASFARRLRGEGLAEECRRLS